MLKALREALTRGLGERDEDPRSREHAVRLATATLLVEVVRADYEEDLTEHEVVVDQLRSFFELTEDEVQLLMAEARQQADHAVSLQSFTRLLHECLTLSEKHAVIEMLWRVALADAYLDKHEDHLVRKVAGLLYISHGDLIRIRNRVHADSKADW